MTDNSFARLLLVAVISIMLLIVGGVGIYFYLMHEPAEVYNPEEPGVVTEFYQNAGTGFNSIAYPGEESTVKVYRNGVLISSYESIGSSMEAAILTSEDLSNMKEMSVDEDLLKDVEQIAPQTWVVTPDLVERVLIYYLYSDTADMYELLSVYSNSKYVDIVLRGKESGTMTRLTYTANSLTMGDLKPFAKLIDSKEYNKHFINEEEEK